MMMFARRVASVLMLGLGLSGTLGCELIAAVDHSLLDVDAGLPPGTGGEGGVGGQGGTGGNGGAGGGAVVCGDGEVGAGEGCDDGDVAAGDGCDATCAIELGYSCVGEPSVCSTDCGDGNVSGSEACDDGNNDADDGCDAACVVEAGYSCTGMPSVCVTSCGDGIIAGAEECDDSNMLADDGCDDVCAVEPGYTCTGMPSACVTSCGDGIIAGAEECDDQNTTAADGCDDMCAVEPGYSCTGEPSVCTPGCGDGIIAGGEECDDSNVLADDGCDPSCDVENGFVCMGMPSVCTSVCGDGIIAGLEACDDGGTAAGDGCSAACLVEAGYTCANMPSMCSTICGDGLIVGAEACDDGGTSGGDGCSAACVVEDGFSCAGMPSMCAANCGDGVVLGAETCDDGDIDGGDGCSSACLIESGYSCAGMPSMCTPICGDGMVLAGEDCDDGDTDDADGCSAICTVEMGYGCVGSPSVCAPICGDGAVIAPEMCDDGDADSGDGCSSTCLLEPGFTCVGVPTVCTANCGDGLIVGTETCDDGGTMGGDGCSAMCATEPGYACMGAPSVCMTVCGDGILTLVTEACDDGNTDDGDCCSAACTIEPGCELEPNDTLATAMDWDVLNIGGQMQGFVTPASDLDWYSFTVPDGTTGTVTAESLDGPLGSSCVANEVDTLITIHDSGGMQLAVDDDQGPGFCSIVTVTGLLPGEYYVRVRNSPQDPVATFDYTLALTITLSPCGNGVFEVGEQCDDGNMADGDGCNGFCKLECTAEVEPNGTSATANGPFTPSNELGSFHCAAISPVADQDYYRIDLTATADLRIQTFDLNGPSTCVGGQVPVLTLRASDGTTVLATGVNKSATESCKVIDSTTVPAARHLPVGTYYVRVEDSGNNSLIPGYTLLVTYNALCGDGVVEGYEECDGGPTCGPTCDRIPSCGDGFIDAPETCDDGNMADGDGCSSACVFETLAEVEPNGTLLEADARALDPSPILITSDRRIAGSIGAVGDQDVFRLELAAPQVVRFEVFDGAGFDCGGLTTNMRVFNSAGLDVKFDTGLSEFNYAGGIGTGAGGQGRCSALVINLAAGTYYVRVEETSNDATIAAYQLQVELLTYLGSEVEPNDTLAQATVLTGTDIAIFGDHQVNLDVDYYAITVPQGASIRIETVEGDAETCEFNGVDTTISLHDAAGVQIAQDTNQGRGDCSLIDGTGVSPPNDPTAHTLNAGTYYIRVNSPSSGLAGQFNYHLAITVRFP